MSVKKEIFDRIKSIYPDSEIYIKFDEENSYVSLQVISAEFENISLVKQHQNIKRSLAQHLKDSIHALQLKTFTPKKWEEQKKNLI